MRKEDRVDIRDRDVSVKEEDKKNVFYKRKDVKMEFTKLRKHRCVIDTVVEKKS